MKQTDRVVVYLRSHPMASSLEITLATGVVNTTGRISDARAKGIDIVCLPREDGNKGYVIKESRPVTTGEAIPMGL